MEHILISVGVKVCSGRAGKYTTNHNVLIAVSLLLFLTVNNVIHVTRGPIITLSMVSISTHSMLVSTGTSLILISPVKFSETFLNTYSLTVSPLLEPGPKKVSHPRCLCDRKRECHIIYIIMVYNISKNMK